MQFLLITVAVKRSKKEIQIGARVDEATRARFDEIKQNYGFESDAEALRGIILLFASKEQILSEVEGRIANHLMPLFESRINEIFQSEEFKELVLNIVVDELNKGTGRFGH